MEQLTFKQSEENIIHLLATLLETILHLNIHSFMNLFHKSTNQTFPFACVYLAVMGVFLSPPVCRWMWDNLTCWQPAKIGEVVWMPCPELFEVMNEEYAGM